MSEQPTQRPVSSTVLGLGALTALALCCLGPVLLVGGSLAAVGSAVSNPVVVLAGLLLVAVAAAMLLRRRKSGDQSCCVPHQQDGRPRTEDRLDGLS
jgi:LPXTG-motif cell wall-anchored protein